MHIEGNFMYNVYNLDYKVPYSRTGNEIEKNTP